MKKTAMIIVAAICLFGLLTACMQGQDRNGTGNQSNNIGNMDTTPFKATDTGVLVQKDEVNQRWLVTQYVEKEDQSYIDAIWFKITDETQLEDMHGQKITRNELQVGQRVEAWVAGEVADSYPQQATAAKFVILDNKPDQTADYVDSKTAIQTALNQSQTGQVLAVKQMVWQEEQAVWTVELVEGGKPDSAVTLHIDGGSGEIVPEVVLENDAFRVYGPVPESEMGSTFNVSGKARVFEGAFSWYLEDGHSILAEGHVQADEGAPGWGNFEFEVTFEKASNPHIMLILYEASAKDGSPQHQLIIPLKPKEELIQYKVD